jgi:2-oxoisovalerate dehydrogenase E1 component
MEEEADQTVLAASEKALSQPNPRLSEATKFIFSIPDQPQKVGGMAAEGLSWPDLANRPKVIEPRRLNMVEAIRRTLDVELGINPRCLVFGEDVADKGGVHTATLGLASKYGNNRVFDTGLSEEGIIGRAVGMALAGLLPVPEIQFRKYADPATEQLNNCGTIRWRTANHFAAPIIVRMPGGYGRKIGDPWHSVTNEVMFAHAPGWQVAFPSNAQDAVGLLRTALRGNDPVIFFEHRALLDAASARRPYPGDDYGLPFGQANMIQEGSDLSVVTWGAMVERCQEAAQRFEGQIELIDMRTIIPWDKEAVLASVAKTSKCLVVHEDIGIAGFGAEIAATIAAEAFLALDGPVERLAAPAVPVPFNLELMTAVVPTVDRISEKMAKLLSF